MDEIITIIEETINQDLVQAIFSKPANSTDGSKVKIRPVMLKGQICFQETRYVGTQVFHKNFSCIDMKKHIIDCLIKQYYQIEITTSEAMVNILISKKQKVTIKKKCIISTATETKIMDHNRTKKYVLEEGIPVDFLVGLGVQTKEGKIINAKYDKFRQINRYLEFIEDIVKQLPKNRTVRIIDFGCGKSYLTFAMYYYLHVLNGYDIQVTGLDLKTDVIKHCNELAQEYHYDKLHFEMGDISTYEGASEVDMVVTLHACDTATDYAIEKAIKWNAKVIMVVPCCQHEVNRQIACDELAGVLKYGLIKERISALVTDAIRANILEEMGYDTQVLEFIDLEHTPKNILIRAVKRDGIRKKSIGIKKTTDYLHVETTLQKLICKHNMQEMEE